MVELGEICAVPGCENPLTEEQKNERKVVCESCEAAKMHVCEVCGRQISAERIRDGATLCKECEMNPTDLGEQESEMPGLESEYGADFEEDFSV